MVAISLSIFCIDRSLACSRRHVGMVSCFASPVSLVPRAKLQAQSGSSKRSTLSALGASRLPIRPSLLGSRERSRSPLRDGLPVLRVDAPSRRPRLGAQLPMVLTEEDEQQAIDELEKDILATTTSKSHASHLRTITVALSHLGSYTMAADTHYLEGFGLYSETWRVCVHASVFSGISYGVRTIQPPWMHNILGCRVPQTPIQLLRPAVKENSWSHGHLRDEQPREGGSHGHLRAIPLDDCCEKAVPRTSPSITLSPTARKWSHGHLRASIFPHRARSRVPWTSPRRPLLTNQASTGRSKGEQAPKLTVDTGYRYNHP